MNKEVIYIEPEDDITDIITKIENSKEKIVALVPPKKAGVLRSIVNIKLIAKTGTNSKKTIVLVTTDSSIIKLAAAAHLPVTKDLKSAPVIPEFKEDEENVASKEELVDAGGDEKEAIEEDVEISAPAEEDEEDSEEGGDKEEDNEPEDKKDAKNKKRSSDKKESKNPVINWIKEHKKLSIILGVGGLVLIIFLIWATVIAPAATITVEVRTTTGNFSENATFTDVLADENASEGKFYIEEKKIESKSEVEFTATGQKNVGNKAKGEVVVYAYFRQSGNIPINSGSSFTISGLTFKSENNVTLSWNGKDISDCENNNEASAVTSGCLISGRVDVVASAPGEEYNIAPSSTGWNTNVNVAVYSDQSMTGGTNQMVTVVQQSDIDKAISELETKNNESESKKALFESIDDDKFIIESSFKQTVGDAISSPAVGEVVEEGKTPKLSITTTDTVFVIDKTKVEEFIKEKAKLANNYKIYSMNDPFVESFTKVDGGYTGKIKTSYVSGPEITENGVIDVVKGKGIGTAQHDLKDAFDGIGLISIDPSFPWVSSIPNDPNKITVILDTEE